MITNRVNILQKIIDKKHAKTYLEVGVRDGYCFLQIRAWRKIGVDIRFKLRMKTLIKRIIKHPTNIFNKYYEMGSDRFFAEKARLFKNNKIDVAFIDGLHEYNQVLRDVNNCLNFLSKDGVIVLHDCNPLSALIATPLAFLESEINSRGDVRTHGWGMPGKPLFI